MLKDDLSVVRANIRINLERIAHRQAPSLISYTYRNGVKFSRTSWLLDHLDNFVAPILGKQTPYRLPEGYKHYFTSDEMTVLKNMWRVIKKAAKGRTILLPGRDTWVLEVLARRDGTKTYFRPDISSAVAGYIKKTKCEDFSQYFCVDSGYSGTVPRNLGVQEFYLIQSSPCSEIPAGLSVQQQHRLLYKTSKRPLMVGTAYNNFKPWQPCPRNKGISGVIAAKMEGCPRYWDSGTTTVKNGKETIVQNKTASKDFFYNAALFTIELFTDSSPRFVPRPFALPEAVKNPQGQFLFRDKMYPTSPYYGRCPVNGCLHPLAPGNYCQVHHMMSNHIYPAQPNLQTWETEL